ncbi:hypothetical protein Glove_149g139 [Diversispora epigaea]|uniref:AAA-ATPase-like domain-containing protein n=1 Tax=Diversispora epigaea TaxID=1348612 RepID=A0A397J200_9GLOM|nr:hypothetical protein Glove_149g139 [Diversispora epigaea]
MYRYKQELGEYFYNFNKKSKNALANFKNILNAVELSGHKLYIFIDEYDAGINEALKNESILQSLKNNNKNEDTSVRCKIELIDNSFKQFFSHLKDACNMGIAHVFLTGVTPVVLSEFTSGLNISEDLTTEKEFWDLYGFKKSEIELLLDKAFGNSLSNIKERLITWLKEENDRYFFHPKQPEGIFNTAYVLYCIKKFMKQKEELGNSSDSSVILNTLLDISSDLNTLPSQTTLDLIINNPLGKSILSEILNQSSLKLKKYVKQQFQLTNICKLATDCISLLSFMFYTGVFTYKSGSYELQIPNNIIKRELIAKALKIYN